jgi:hypothetical protein
MKTKATESKTWECVGFVPVDSGQLMLVDPCYVTADFDVPFKGDKDRVGVNYNSACSASLTDEPTFGSNEHVPHLGMCFGTGGDGCFNVFVKRNTLGQVIQMKLVIREEA